MAGNHYNNFDSSSGFFYYNFSNFGSTFYTIYILSTVKNFPDLITYRWKDNGYFLVLVVCVYVFFMSFMLMNLLIAIVYTNYKEYFQNVIQGLANQEILLKIIECSESEDGNIKVKLMRKLLEVFYLNNSKAELDKHIKEELIKREQKKILKKVRHNRLKVKKALDSYIDEYGTMDDEDYIKYSDRNPGYNQKHKKAYSKIRKSAFYQYFFIFVNLYIVIKPIYILEVERFFYEFSPYAAIDIACMIS